MNPIRIVVAQSRPDVIAGVIADAVIESREFELVGGQARDYSTLLDPTLGADAPIHALIVVGELAPAVDVFLAQRRPKFFSHIDIGGDVVRFDVSGLSLDGLFDELRRQVRNNNGGAEGRLDYQLVAEAHGTVREPRLVAVEPLRSELTGLVLTWLDAALLRQVQRTPHAEGDIPGVARTLASAEALLKSPAAQTVNAPNDPAEVAEEALFDALDEPNAAHEPLTRCLSRFHLTRAEMKLLMLALAPELDVRYHTVFGVLCEEMGRRSPSLGLACAVAGDPAGMRALIAETQGLTLWRLLETGAQLPRAEDPLRLDPTLLAWLAADADALIRDPRLREVLSEDAWRGAELLCRREDLAASGRLFEALVQEQDWDWLVLSGPDAAGWRAHLELAARDLKLDLLRVSLLAVARQPPADARECVVRIARAARALDLVIAIDAEATDPEIDTVAALRLIAVTLAELDQRAVLVTPDPDRFAAALHGRSVNWFEREDPGHAGLVSNYLAAAADAGLTLAPADAERLASAFPLSLPQIEDALALALVEGAATAPAARQYELIAAKCRRVASPGLPRFARRISPTYTLDQVVLPAEWHAQLTELVGHVSHSAQVMNAWGFGAQMSYGRGVAALFSGPSGTGKTMAAQAIASALQTEAFLVDLSRVVSKFIGESEKNLDVVFGEAERAGAVLVFDEADAIFGKRSEIKDAHDRYANIEVAYLLQRIEAYSGLVILTTNFKQNLDTAFLRRLRFLVEFPKPDAAAREAIWRQCLPAAAPVDQDIDFAALASGLDVAGGAIRQITLRAAFAAAREGSSIGMRHLLAAARAELVKLGRTAAIRDFEGFAALYAKPSRQAA